MLMLFGEIFHTYNEYHGQTQTHTWCLKSSVFTLESPSSYANQNSVTINHDTVIPRLTSEPANEFFG